MSRKTFLTSGLILGLAVSPAIADTLYNTDIADSCTVDILGSSSGNAANSFTAQYAPIKYTSAAGTYLLFSNGEISENQTCPTGSYCPGFTNVDFADATMGLNTCPTIDSVAFTSASGSSAVTNCYQEDTAMSSALLNPFTTDHLDTSKNTDGYINGVKYASASTAARRYATSTTAAGDWTALDESDIQITDLSCNTGYHYKEGGNPLASLNLMTGVIRQRYKSIDSTSTEPADLNNGDWEAILTSGTVTGKALCSTTSGELTTTGTPDESGSGEYCWCKIDGVIPAGGSKQNLSGAWMLVYYPHAILLCEHNCASECARAVSPGPGRRLYDTVPASPAICEANEITITWNQNNGQADITNTCTYDGDITLPSAPTKTGYTFSGWKLVTGSTQARCELITDDDECNATPGCGHGGNALCNYIVDDCSSITDENQCLHGVNNNACHFCGWKDGMCVKDSSWPC